MLLGAVVGLAGWMWRERVRAEGRYREFADASVEMAELDVLVSELGEAQESWEGALSGVEGRLRHLRQVDKLGEWQDWDRGAEKVGPSGIPAAPPRVIRRPFA